MRVLSRLQQTLWPSALRETLCTADQIFDDVTDRMVLVHGTGIQPDQFRRVLASRAHTLLCSKEYASLSSFLDGYSAPDA